MNKRENSDFPFFVLYQLEKDIFKTVLKSVCQFEGIEYEQ